MFDHVYTEEQKEKIREIYREVFDEVLYVTKEQGEKIMEKVNLYMDHQDTAWYPFYYQPEAVIPELSDLPNIIATYSEEIIKSMRSLFEATDDEIRMKLEAFNYLQMAGTVIGKIDSKDFDADYWADQIWYHNSNK